MQAMLKDEEVVGVSKTGRVMDGIRHCSVKGKF